MECQKSCPKVAHEEADIYKHLVRKFEKHKEDSYHQYQDHSELRDGRSPVERRKELVV